MATKIQFDLTEAEIRGLLAPRGNSIRMISYTAALAGVGLIGVIVGAVQGSTGPLIVGAVAVLLAAAFGYLVLVQVPRVNGRLAGQLQGRTTVRLTDAGADVAHPSSPRAFAWSDVFVLNDRPGVWVIGLGGGAWVVIPKSAAGTPEQCAALGRQLRTWAKGKYKLRRH